MPTRHNCNVPSPRPARKGRRWLVALGFVAWVGLLSSAEPSVPAAVSAAPLPSVASDKIEAVLHTLVQYKWSVLLLLLSLIGLIHIARKLATESERRKLNIIQRCLIGSIILHLLAGFFFTAWVVSNAVKRSVIEVSAESNLVPIDLASLDGQGEGGGGEADPRLLQALREQVSNLPRAAAGMSVARAAGQSGGGGGSPMRNGNVMTGGATGRTAPSASFTVSESSPTENGRLETASSTTLAPQAAQMSGSLEARADTSVPRPEMVRPSLDLTAPSRMAVQQVTPEMARPAMNVRVQRPGTSASRMVQVATAESSGATGESTSASASLPAASAAGAASALSAMSANTPSTTGVQMESARPVAASASGPTMQNPSSRMDTARGEANASGATSTRAEMSASSPTRAATARSAAGSAVGSFGATSDSATRSESLSAASAAGAMAAMAGGNASGAASSAMQMEAGRLGGSATGATSGAGMASASSRMDVARAAGSAGASGNSSATPGRAAMGNGALAGGASGAAGAARGSSAVGSFGPVSSGNSGGGGEGLAAANSASSLSSSTGNGAAGGSAAGGMQMEAGRLGGGASGARSGSGLAGASSRMDVSRSGSGNGSSNGGSTAPGRAAMGNGALAGGPSGAGQGSGSSAVGSFGPVSGGGGSGGGLGSASSAGSLSSIAGGGSASGSTGGGMQMEAGRLGGGAADARSGSGLAGASSRMDVSRSGSGNGSGNGGSTAPERAAMGSGTGTGGKSGAGRGTGSSAVGAFGPATGGGSGGGESLGAAGASGALGGTPQFAMTGGGGFRAEMASPAAGAAGRGSDVGRASSKVGVSRASGAGSGESGSGPARLGGPGGTSGGASKFGSFAAAQKVEFGSGTSDGGRGLGGVNFGQPSAAPKFGEADVKLETRPANIAATPKPTSVPEARPSAPIASMKAAPIVTKVERPVSLIAKAPMDLAPLRSVLQPSAKIESVELSRPSELPTSAATRLMDMAVPVRPAVSSLIDTKNPLALRSPEMRAGLLEQLGGNDETEAAVRRALEWFKRTQERDGHWTRGGQGHHSSATALAMLCFMGYGAKHTEPGPYQETLERAMSWLLKQSKAEGDVRGDGDLYDQAIVTMALAEAFNLTKDPRLQEPVRKAVSFIVTAQNKTTGGWRYKPWARDPQEKGDLSVTGWQIMALKSASLAGVEVPSSAFTGAGKFIESLGRGRHGGLYGYRSSDPEPKPTMTAQALFSRLLLGQGTGDARTAETLVYMREQLPSLREVNYYYWYYGCLALYQHQGAVWEEWNGRMRPIFLKAQRRDGQLSGSWDAEGDRKETYGRFITTALATLSLEVYYRYLPLYKPTLTAASEAQK